MLSALLELLQRQLAGGRRVEFEQVAEAHVAQGAAAGLLAGRGVGRVRGQRGVEAGELACKLLGKMAAQGVARGVQGVRIRLRPCASASVASPGRVSASATKAAPRSAWVCSRRRAASTKLAGQTGARPRGNGGRGVEDQRRGQALSGFPGVERVAFVGQQHGELLRRVGEVEDDRRREVAQQRGDRLGGDVVEDEGLRRRR